MDAMMIKRVNSIFHHARYFVRSSNLEGMNIERKKLVEMVRDNCVPKEVLRDFDGEMKYLDHSLHCL